MVRVCFVCLGNICRSPTAEAIMRHLVEEEGLADRVEVQSAGTGSWHVGHPPDRRSQRTAGERGYKLDGSARRFEVEDFERFDLVIAMDTSNRDDLHAMAPDESAAERIHLLRDFDAQGERGQSVPDPYYGGERGFDDVFDICEAGCRGLLAVVRDRLER